MKTISRNLLLLAIAWATVSATALAGDKRIAGSDGKKHDHTNYVSEDDIKPLPVKANEVRVSNRGCFVGGLLLHTDWCVAREVMEKQPRWDGLTTEPPLSVQKAAALALPSVKRRFPDVKEWWVETFRLHNVYDRGYTNSRYSFPNVWVYEITFTPQDKNAREKIGGDVGFVALTEVVLPDGTVVPRRIVKRSQVKANP